METWVKVSGTKYSVSDEGKVRNDSTRRILKQTVVKGYARVALSTNGKVKRCYVHQLVAKSFLPNKEGLKEVNHKNLNKLDNSVQNLEWCDRTWNNQHALGISLEIDGVTYLSYGEAHRATGIAISTLRRRVAKGVYQTKRNY